MPSSAGKAVLPLSRENGFFDIWKIAKNRPREQKALCFLQTTAEVKAGSARF